NLMGAAVKFPDQTAVWQQDIAPGSGLRVGVTSVVSPAVAKAISTKDPEVHFSASAPELQTVLKKMEEARTDLRVLLYQGPVDKSTACAEAFPQFQVVLSLCEEDVAPSKPREAGRS